MVRVTDSGLGCPTWPHCFPGSFVPVGHGQVAVIRQAVERAAAKTAPLLVRPVSWAPLVVTVPTRSLTCMSTSRLSYRGTIRHAETTDGCAVTMSGMVYARSVTIISVSRTVSAESAVQHTFLNSRQELGFTAAFPDEVHRPDSFGRVGVHVRLRRSKTDQDGTGTGRSLPFTARHEHCPPCAWHRWAQVVTAFDTDGRVEVIRTLTTSGPFDAHVCRGRLPCMSVQAPLFRSIRKNGTLSDTPLSGVAVHAAIRRRAARAGYDPAVVTQLGGHSLRAGFVTQAFRNGADAHAIMRQTGHTTPAMVEVYARENAPLIGDAVNDLGL